MENLIDLISDSIKEWLHIYKYEVSTKLIKITLLLIFCSGVIPLGVKIIRNILLWIETRRAQVDLFPLIEKIVVKEARQNYILTKFQNISPGDEHEPSYAYASTAKENMMSFFLKRAFIDDSEAHRYYLLLADSGMGKSTFLINLFIRYQRRFFKKYKILLVPLGNPQADNEWQKIDSNQQKNTLLFLDAFDEDPKAGLDYEERLQDILRQTRGFRAIVLTSRTQFFPSEKEEPHRTGVYRYSLNHDTSHYFKKMYLSPFDDKDVKMYLRKKYPSWNIFNWIKRRQAKKLVKLSPNLIVRPMLLILIQINNVVFFKYGKQVSEMTLPSSANSPSTIT
ncbi:hypothetical protein [Spirosoma utsteinense]|uniref:hypothetical protein n=1 Tax=Spirosoma utsteinense TaxID=2585773 RepID=UPI0016445CC5|nr:hypothetical protein [Spirosoma utsteinense]MBC3788370.1 putative NACHT family NTPase [Spirosoma utsteinense]